MAMKKYTQSEGKLEVLRGREANVLNDHFSKTGKFAVSDFSDDEREALNADLDAARQAEKEDAQSLAAAESDAQRDGDPED